MTTPDTHDEFEARLLAQVETISAIGRAMLPHGRCDVDDLVQEVLLRAWASKDKLRDLDRLPQWVAIIARNTARSWGRCATPVYKDSLPDAPASTPTALERVESQERWEALLRALGSLHEADRRLLLARYEDDASYADLGADEALSYSAVTTRVHRARERVRRLLVGFAGAAAAAFVGQEQRAFGQVARRTGGDPALVTVIVVVSAAVLGAVGLGLNARGDGAPPAAETTVAIRVVEPDATPGLAELIDDIRRYDGAVGAYVATFSRRSQSWPTEGGRYYVNHEILREGTVTWRGDHVAAKVATKEWDIDEGGSRVARDGAQSEITTDGELMAHKRYYGSGEASTHIRQAGPSQMSEYNMLAAWQPAGMSLADYLVDRAGDVSKDMAVSRVFVDGTGYYRVSVSAPDRDAASEFLIDPERGYRIVRASSSWGASRWETEVEPRHAGGDIWYPVRVTRTRYAVADTAVVESDTLEITSFIGAADIPDETFAAVPARGNPFYDELREYQHPEPR